MRGVCETSLARSYPEILRGDAARFETYRLRWLANAPDGFAAINRMLAGMDMAADYAKITCPTLVDIGMKDKTCPYHTIMPVSAKINAPKGLHVYPDLVHSPCTDFNAHALSWLRRYLGA